MRQYVFPERLGPKRPSETAIITFEWFPVLAYYWQPGVMYAVNAHVRPLAPTGWAYKRIGGGVSGKDEPAWPRVLGDTVVDGSGSWEAVAAGANGLAVPSSPVCAVEPLGLALGPATLVDGEGPSSRVQVSVSGGSAGIRYFLRSMITAGAEILEGTVVLPVDDTV